MQATASPPSNIEKEPKEDSTSDADIQVSAENTETPSIEDSESLEPKTDMRSNRRKMQWKRFLAGMSVTAAGLALMLIVTAGMIVDVNDDRLSLPVVALSMVLGLMMLGGGFGVMATAAPSFDDGEFDRLMAESRPRAKSETSGE